MQTYIKKKSNSLVSQIASIENLMLAWRKVETSFQHGDVWYDEIDIARFRFRMLENVRNISQALLEGTYCLHPVFPAPFPKGCSDPSQLEVRQSFLINVEDQVVWMAVVNIIGRVFEEQMPAWSYGNRLNVPVWKRDGQWVFGVINSVSKSLYRSWPRSWPMYRKHLTATIKKMAFATLNDDEHKDVSDNLAIENCKSYLKLPYFQEGYFDCKVEKSYRDLYWLSLDLTKFYQKVDMDSLCKLICEKFDDDEEFCKLIEVLSQFKIDYLNYSDDELAVIQLNRSQDFKGLPTGLVVAGFLANVFLLDVDKEIEKKLNSNRDIVHFRYVDDHVFVATSPEKLKKWTEEYVTLLQDNKGLEINKDKYAPEGIAGLMCKDLIEKADWEIAKLNPMYPSPLMTETLQKVSALSKLNIEMLSDTEFEMVFKDLQVLLVTDIPEEEIKKGTRISFTCMLLSKMLSDWDCDMEEVYRLRKEWLERVDKYKVSHPELSSNEIASMKSVAFLNGSAKEVKAWYDSSEHTDKSNWSELKKLIDLLNEGHKNEKKKAKKIFNLLIKAIYEVPEKSKIWIRTLDFCSRNLPDNLLDLFQELKRLKNNKKLHVLGYEYLYALLLIRIAHNMVQALNRVAENNYAIPHQKDNDCLFLEKAMAVECPNSVHYMVNDAILVYRKAASLYIAHQEDLKLQKIERDDDFCKDIDYHGDILSANFWLLWGIYLLNRYAPSENLRMKSLFQKFIPSVKIDDIYFFPLLCYCLNELKEADYNNLQFKGKYSLPSGVNAFEFFYNISYLPEASVLKKKVLGYNKYIKPYSGKSKIRLSDWLYKLSFGDDVEAIYQSEYFATKIAHELAVSVRNNLVKGVCLHPYAIKLNIQNVGKSQNKNEWIDCDVKLVLDSSNNGYVDDSCYMFPTKVLNTNVVLNRRYIYGIGMIFLQLISKRVSMPWVVYRPEFGFEWMKVLKSLMARGDISSENFMIIRSCLSERNRENLRLKQVLDDYVYDEMYDGKTYVGIDELIKDLQNSLESIEHNMVSVAGNQKRQLRVIQLK